MSDSLIFNDLSLPFKTLIDCQTQLPGFFKILHYALDNQIETILVDDSVGSNWFQFNYHQDFQLSKWLSESDLDKGRYIKRVMDKTKFPLLELEVDLEKFQNSSFKTIENNLNSPALGAAAVVEKAVISFLSIPLWAKDSIEIIHEIINEEGNVETYNHHVSNLSQLPHLEVYIEKFTSERQNSQQYLKNLKRMENVDFPNLIFCTQSLDGFKDCDVSEKLLNRIIEILVKLNLAIMKSETVGTFIAHTGLEITGESETTKNSTKLMSFRRIKIPDGRFYDFDLHIKNFPNGKRMYLEPDFNSRKVYIGYFGNHLPI